jgi:hypothetical protein
VTLAACLYSERLEDGRGQGRKYIKILTGYPSELTDVHGSLNFRSMEFIEEIFLNEFPLYRKQNSPPLEMPVVHAD